MPKRDDLFSFDSLIVRYISNLISTSGSIVRTTGPAASARYDVKTLDDLLAISLAQVMALNQNLAQRDLIVLNISKQKYCFNKSRDMSRDHFAKNRKLLTNWWPI